MNTRQNNFAKIIFEFQTFRANTFKTARTNFSANIWDNAISTKIIATVLNLQKCASSLRSMREFFKIQNIFYAVNMKNLFAIGYKILCKFRDFNFILSADNNINAFNIGNFLRIILNVTTDSDNHGIIICARKFSEHLPRFLRTQRSNRTSINNDNISRRKIICKLIIFFCKNFLHGFGFILINFTAERMKKNFQNITSKIFLVIFNFVMILYIKRRLN